MSENYKGNIKLGENIRKIREAFGLKQEELAEYLSLNFRTISQYELGLRDVYTTDVEKIAELFNVSTDTLMGKREWTKSDFQINQEVEIPSITYLLPIECSEKALCNNHFGRAYSLHQKFFSFLNENINGDKEYSDTDIDDLFEEYEKALDDDNAKYEAAANILTLLSLIIIVVWSQESFRKPAIGVLKICEIKQWKIEDYIISEDEYAELKEIVNSHEFFKEIWKLRRILKNSHLADVCYYNIALATLFNVFDEASSVGASAEVGIGMMYDLSFLGNMYARRCLSFFESFLDSSK